MRRLMRELRLATVCESARCPNLGECFGAGTATFMILGDVCTRRCGFCAVDTGLPDRAGPGRAAAVAAAVRRMGLRHAVVTSVTRDDLAGRRRGVFAATIRAIRARAPGLRASKCLIPDFAARPGALATVIAAGPTSSTTTSRPCRASTRACGPAPTSCARSRPAPRSGDRPGDPDQVGADGGPRREADEIVAVLRDLAAAGVAALTIGQYLRPLREPAVERYWHPEEFAALGAAGRAGGSRGGLGAARAQLVPGARLFAVEASRRGSRARSSAARASGSAAEPPRAPPAPYPAGLTRETGFSRRGSDASSMPSR